MPDDRFSQLLSPSAWGPDPDSDELGEAWAGGAPREPRPGDGRPQRTGRTRPIRHSTVRRRRLRLALVAAVLLLVLPVVALAGATAKITDNAVSSVRRIPNALPTGPVGSRPNRVTTGPAAAALNFLLIGTDTRSEEPNGVDPVKRNGEAPAWGRTDTVMIVHLSADRRKSYVVSIPRDSWVQIGDRGPNKINAAYAFGGPQLLVQTVEKFTNIHIDHVAVVDFAGFLALSNAIGGVAVNTESGTKWLYGVEALNFVRERKNLARGDFDRVQRQQAFMRAVMSKVLTADTLTNPARLNDTLTAVANAVSVDDGLDNAKLRDLALSLRHLRSQDVLFLTTPISGTGREEGLSVVRLDQERGATLYQAIREDKVGLWLAKHDTDTLGSAVEDPIKRRPKATPSASGSATGEPSAGSEDSGDSGDSGKSDTKAQKSKSGKSQKSGSSTESSADPSKG